MKIKKIAAAVIAAAVLVTTVSLPGILPNITNVVNAADTVIDGDYEYQVNEDEETVTITKYNGTDAEVSIPSTLGGKNVTSIGNQAFFCCESLTSVTIPDSVTEISYGAFISCESLERIEVGENNAKYSSINGVLFNNDKSELICYPAGKKDKLYVIPDSVTSIGERAFNKCKCTNVTISDGIISIGEDAFSDCGNITSLTIPNSVINISDDFVNCDSLAAINVMQDNANYSSINGVLFDKNQTTLIRYPEGKGKVDTSYSIPDSVTKIDDLAFRNCSNLVSITIPDNVIHIGQAAFWICCSLTSIIIPNGVTIISNDVFSECSSLTTVTIPESVTIISNCAFRNCSNLKDVYFGGSKTQWEKMWINYEMEDSIKNATIHFAKEDDLDQSETEETEPDVSTEPDIEITTEDTTTIPTIPEPTITTTPEPVVTTTPEPIVTTTPEPVVTTAPEPERRVCCRIEQAEDRINSCVVKALVG